MKHKLLVGLPLVALFAAGCAPSPQDVSHPIVQTPAAVAPMPTPTPPHVVATSTTPTPAPQSGYEMTTSTISEKGTSLIFDITYPQMTNASDADLQKKFNQVIYEKNIKDQVAQMRTDVANAVKEGMMTSAPWSLSLHGGVTYQNAHLINVFLRGSQDTGGAHPNAYYENVLFDTALKQDVSFPALFTDASSSMQTIAAWVRAELKNRKVIADLSDDSWFADGTEPTETNYRFSHLTSDGLVVTFPPYQVAAYAAGEQEVTIPWAKVNPLLKSEYQKK